MGWSNCKRRQLSGWFDSDLAPTGRVIPPDKELVCIAGSGCIARPTGPYREWCYFRIARNPLRTRNRVVAGSVGVVDERIDDCVNWIESLEIPRVEVRESRPCGDETAERIRHPA